VITNNSGRGGRAALGVMAIEGSTVLAALIILFVVSAVFAPGFMTSENLTNVLVQSVFVIILGIGMTFVLVAGGIDLSVGSTMGLSGALCIYSMNSGVPFVLALLIGLAAGALVGLFNSYFITVLRIADFIVTLGTLSLVRGIVELMTANSPLDSRSDAFSFLTGGTVLGIPAAVLIAVAVILIGGITLAKTPMGRSIYAVGLNPASAYLAGVRVPRVRVGVYVVSALSGILLSSRLSSAPPAAGTGYELTAIAAAAVGGTSLAGGRGSVLGTVLGALLLGVLQNSLSLLRVNAFWFQIITGLMIVAAVLLDGAIKRFVKSRPVMIPEGA
jgi:ribose transport system permease protein